MKELTTYNRAAGYLNSIFDLLNKKYFESALSRPIITIQSTPKAYGHYTLYDAWSVDGEKGFREINIGAGTLSRPIDEVTATLLHEMVHYHNDKNGVKDCSRGNTYHNKNFRLLAEKCGLCIDHHPTYGWSITKPGDELLTFCIDNDLRDIRLNRMDEFSIRIPGASAFGGSSKKSSSRKYVCPLCGMSIRATRDVRVLCMDCGEQMRCGA
jgi:hypothetical protein